MKRKPTRTEVDGTTPGKAVLISIKFGSDDVAQHSFDPFIESDTVPNPEASAQRMRTSVIDDFPDREFTVVSNQRARFLGWQTQMAELLGGEHTVDDYLSL